MPAPGPRAFRSSRALLVRAADVGESDRRLTFFTETAGVVTARAKAAHRSRKRFGGILQRYLLLDIAWTERPARPALLESASVVSSLWPITADWEKARHADYLLELAAALFPQPAPPGAVFGLLLYGLRAVAEGEPPVVAVRKVEAASLSLGGWGPLLSGCRRCGRTAPGPFRFVPSEGGIYCRGCPGKAGSVLTAGAVRTWKALQSAAPEALARVRISEVILEELQDVIPKYVEWCLGRPLRSLGGGAPPG